MMLDASMQFVPVGAPLSCVGATGQNFPSGIVDLAGVGVGVAPGNIFGTQSVFGEDIGVGDSVVDLVVATGTAFVTSDSCTLNCQLQAAPDNGAYQPGTWQTIAETGALTAAQLAANTTIMPFKMTQAFPANENPRFLRINFVTPAGEQFTAGTIAYAVPSLVRDALQNKQTSRNYSVA